MPTFVDVSNDLLKTKGVLSLLKEHMEDRGPEPIFFKVTKETFEAFVANKNKAVEVSQDEADKINAFLSVDRKFLPSELTMDTKVKCAKCERIQTFYDVFESGRKMHGDSFTKRFMAGGDYHIQILKKDNKFDVVCTGCGTMNELMLSYECHGGY